MYIVSSLPDWFCLWLLQGNPVSFSLCLLPVAEMSCLTYVVNQDTRGTVISHVVGTVLLHSGNQTPCSFPHSSLSHILHMESQINNVIGVAPLLGTKQLTNLASP